MIMSVIYCPLGTFTAGKIFTIKQEMQDIDTDLGRSMLACVCGPGRSANALLLSFRVAAGTLGEDGGKGLPDSPECTPYKIKDRGRSLGRRSRLKTKQSGKYCPFVSISAENERYSRYDDLPPTQNSIFRRLTWPLLTEMCVKSARMRPRGSKEKRFSETGDQIREGPAACVTEKPGDGSLWKAANVGPWGLGGVGGALGSSCCRLSTQKP